MSTNKNSILSVVNLTAYYGVVKALEDASFEVKSGEIRNGEINFDGKIINGLRTDQLVDLCLILFFYLYYYFDHQKCHKIIQ